MCYRYTFKDDFLCFHYTFKDDFLRYRYTFKDDFLRYRYTFKDDFLCSSLFTDYKGALTEQFVFQQLDTFVPAIYYWSADNSKGEIDFLVQIEDKVVPIEVKAEENLQAKSLKFFVAKNSSLHGNRTSMSCFREQDWMTNVPLYAIGIPGVF